MKIIEKDNPELNMTVTKEEIFTSIHHFNPNKSLGPDGFTIHFYKIC
jgi:hypothetical protein